MGFHVDLEELHKAANKLNQEASRIETQLTGAKNSVNKIITSEALQGKTGQAIYQQLNNVDAAVLVGLADTSKVLASEFSSLLSSFHSSVGETSNSAILDEDYLNQLKDNLNNFKNQHGAQEENISSIYASISDLISLSGPQSNYDADSDTASQLLSTTIDKVTSFDSSGTAPTSADLLAAIDTEVNQVSQTTDLPYTDSQYLSFISDVNFAKSIKSVDKQLTEQEKLAKEQAEQKARKEWAKQHPVVAWLQSQADLDANFFEGARKTLEKQNWDFFGGQLDKSVALTALGFVDGVCETIDQLALGAAQLGQLAFEGIEWGGNTLFKQKTPQWVKADVTGAWNNVMAASEFGTRLIALDADAWNAVAKTGEKVGSDLASAIKTGDDYKIGGYLFDVATFVGPAAVGKLKYVDEASNLAKFTKTSEVASTVGKVEDGVKVGQTTYEIIHQKLIEYNITEAEFNRLRTTRIVDMTKAEYDMMIDIRNAIPHPTSQTVMQKIIPIEEADNYFGENAWGIRGYITKREDVTNITNIKEAVEGLRLDYDGSKFVDADGNIITNGYVRIEFQTKDTDYIDIPFGEQNGIGLDPDPATGHGFIKSDEFLTPEYKTVKPDNKGLLLKNGAKMFLNIDGDEILVGVVKDGKFVYIGG
ncbi:T7SS effector LXG polymorphic toxin [Streptococcus equinus]|uniref:T7SS effector LXG polymorphic toxin n=2 Tax=Streptococcus equinus TaxID=1335 RepID=UPI0008CFCE40|nr:T7SS effector LXG polymorphic toxin [Streptococcus equinus]SEI74229.1 LXG domain of WXG superfamily protein [Streptococcus equinus]